MSGPTGSGYPPNPLQDAFIRVDQAEQLRRQGKLDRAQKICDAVVREHPDYVAALHTLGLIHADRNNLQLALNCLVRAAMLNPRSWSTLTALSGVYLELGAREMAALALEQARAINPQDPAILVTLGEIYIREREYEKAKDAFAEAVALDKSYVAAETGYGWACLHLGENETAARVFEGLLDRGVRTLEVLTALTYLPASLVHADLLDAIDKHVADVAEREGIVDPAIAFVRATALDKIGRHPDAWREFEPANQAVFTAMQGDYRDTLQRQRVVLQALRQNLVSAAREEKTAPVSLFILGPSRSGKTTMELLASTLDGVKRGYENPIADLAIRRTFQNAGLLTSEFFEFLPPQLYPSFREIYLDELKRRAGDAKVFTNTHPARIFDAALVANVVPNARFIFVKRDPDDIMLRIYQRRYMNANAYAYDLKATREHVAWYYQMIDLLHQRLPAQSRIVRYEDMVADPQGAVRTIADLCGLPVPSKPLPPTGDDRNAAAPYRDNIAAALTAAEAQPVKTS